MTTIFNTRGDLLEIEHDTKALRLSQPRTGEAEIAREVPHTTSQGDLGYVKSWLEQGTPGLLHLRSVELEDVEELETKLRAEGLKLRYARIHLATSPT